jgi:hypothetical protein
LEPVIDTRLVLETGTALVLSFEAWTELPPADPPSQPPPKLLVRNPQPATDASAKAKANPVSTAHQALAHRQHHFAANPGRRRQQQIERAAYCAFG